jgi:hypothetical protein
MELQRQGAFARIVEALGEERDVLRAVGLEEPTLEAAATSAVEVLEWYQRHVQPIVGTIEEHARELGFADEHDFLRAATTLFVAMRERARANPPVATGPAGSSPLGEISEMDWLSGLPHSSAEARNTTPLEKRVP